MKPVEIEFLLRNRTRDGLSGISSDVGRVGAQADAVQKGLERLRSKAGQTAASVSGIFPKIGEGIPKETLALFDRMSDELFGGMSHKARQLVEDIQEDTLSLRQVEQMQHALNDAYEQGTLSLGEYLATQARLSVLHDRIAQVVSANEQALRREAAAADVAEDSIAALQMRVTLLTTEYMHLSQAQREGAEGTELLKNISEVQGRLETATVAMNRYGGTARTQFNSLGMSIQQIVREAPALAMGPQMFFLAISNNLPIFADAVARARQEYQMLVAANRQAVPVWRQILSSLLSWQTVMVGGITALVLYGDRITGFVADLFRGKQAFDSTAAAAERFHAVMTEGAQGAQAEITKLQLLYDAATDAAKPYEERATAVEKLQRIYPAYFGSLSSEAIMAGTAEAAYRNLTTAILETAQARVAEKALTENATARLLLERSGNAYEQYRTAYRRESEAEDYINRRSPRTHNLRDAIIRLNEARVITKDARKAFIDELSKLGEEGDALWQRIDETFAGNVDAFLEHLDEQDALLRQQAERSYTRLTPEEQNAGSKGRGGGASRDQRVDEQLLQARRRIEEQQLEIMQEGFAKRRAEAGAAYDRELQDIEAHRRQLLASAAEDRRQGKTTPTDSQIDALFAQQRQNELEIYRQTSEAIDREETAARQQRLQREEEAWDEYLRSYGSFEERVLATTREYDRKIADAGTAGERARLEAEKQQALAELETEGSAWAKSLADKSADELRKMLEEVQSQFDKAKELFEQIGSSSPATAALLRYIAQLEAQIEELRARLEGSRQPNEASDVEQAPGRDWAMTAAGFEAVASGARKAAEAVREVDAGLADVLTALVDVSSGAAQFANSVAAIKAGASFGSIMGGISAGVGLISSIIGLFERGESSMERNLRVAREFNEELRVMNERARINADEGGIFGDFAYRNFLSNVSALRDAQAAYRQTQEQIRNRGEEVYKGRDIEAMIEGLKNGTYTGLSGLYRSDRSWETAAESVANMQVQTQHSTKGFLGIGRRSAKYDSLRNQLPELFDENGELVMENLREFVDSENEVYQHLSEENRAYLRRMADDWETYEQAVDAVGDYLKSVFGELGDVLTDVLVSAVATGTDALESVKDAVSGVIEQLAKDMLQAMFLAPIFEKAEQQMQEVMTGDLSDEERFAAMLNIFGDLVTKVHGQQEAMENWMADAKDIAAKEGITIFDDDEGGTTQQGKAGALYTVSQDSFSRIEGLATSIQMHAAASDLKLGNIVDAMSESLDALNALVRNTDVLPRMYALWRKVWRDGLKAK